MLQVIQNVRNGQLEVKEVPPPALQSGGLLVRTAASVISAGTEKMIMDLAKKSLIGKARERPDIVRQVLQKARSQGFVNTFHNVMTKMDKPLPLGYSAAGVVESVGDGVTDIKIGDRVAIAGAGYASHAEMNFVPRNLTALIPENVSFEQAAYTTVSAIAMQGIRLAKPELSEIVVVSGLGLIGLIAIQILKANGCRVLGMDLSRDKVELGMRLGLHEGVVLGEDDPHRAVDRFSNGRGADLTLITAATSSNQPVELAGEITRRKGRIVVVGAVGLNIPRDVYYKKELELRISMSYGPGRYDRSYEEGGLDYPYDYVRWTEARNIESVLELMSRGALDVDSLTTHRLSIQKAPDAYQMIYGATEPYVGILLEYDLKRQQEPIVSVAATNSHKKSDRLGVGFVGAGNYSSVFLLPHLKSNPAVQLTGLTSATGLNARQKAEKFGFSYCATEIQPLLEDAMIDAIFIGTRHSTHAEFTTQALNAGKHVFVEKPLVVNEEQLDAVIDSYQKANAKKTTGLMVGLNRRFAPMIIKLKDALDSVSALQMIYRVNSGSIPTSTWLHEADEGGGMLVGEMCHFIDLMQFVCGQRPSTVYAQSLRANSQKVSDYDNLSIVISFDGGSVGTLCYNTVGNSAFPKEHLQVFGGGIAAVMDDFRSLEIVKGGRPTRVKAANQDKGQSREVSETIEAFRTRGEAPIPFAELVAGMRVIFGARQSLISGQPVKLIV
ncbi:MAG TPA: bi-domain-containing oxidoreductase [Pyrinomonadaceae bacterium]|jgi:predicted dehydrogenase/threonine dehydrogenase-like Zn-dependent dehydrogenase|nr:bi-domain-containing oxidoreductase [Pyrinomonadaceae bacterium]